MSKKGRLIFTLRKLEQMKLYVVINSNKLFLKHSCRLARFLDKHKYRKPLHLKSIF